MTDLKKVGPLDVLFVKVFKIYTISLHLKYLEELLSNKILHKDPEFGTLQLINKMCYLLMQSF